MKPIDYRIRVLSTVWSLFFRSKKHSSLEVQYAKRDDRKYILLRSAILINRKNIVYSVGFRPPRLNDKLTVLRWRTNKRIDRANIFTHTTTGVYVN